MPEVASGAEDLILPSRLEVLDRVDTTTLEFATRAGFDDAQASSVAMAVIEAVTNAVVHGNRKEAGKTVRITYRWEPKAVTIVVHDEGEGFDLSSVPDPTDPERFMAFSGRGIYIMRQVMDSVRFDMNGRRGTTVTMRKSV